MTNPNAFAPTRTAENAYTPGRAYVVDDLILDSGTVYRCTAAHRALATLDTGKFTRSIAEPVVVCSGTSHSDPGFPYPFAFDDGADHTALSDAEFLTYVQRRYRIVQTGMTSGGTSSGFGSCPLWFRSADASAGTVSIQTLDASVPFEVV